MVGRILEVVAAVDHKYEVPALDVSVTLPPEQKVVGPPGVMVGAEGMVPTVIVVIAVPVNPSPSVTVSVYVVVDAGFATGLEMVDELRPVAGDQE